MGLVLGTPLRVLASRFSTSLNSLHNHRHNHLTPVQKAAIIAAVKPSEIDLEQLERQESEGLIGALVGQRARLQQLVELAMELGDVGKCVAAERAITENLSLVAKLLGQLVTHHEVRSTSILISADYLSLRQAIITALRPFPDAAQAVGQALAQLELAAAKDITERGRPLLLESSPC
jgi:hypothetical protein